MRGTAGTTSAVVSGSGITPAHAGNRLSPYRIRAGLQDHPRTCGEQLSVFFWSMPLTGSPPHMRGTVSGNVWNADVGRITPAHAGNRRSSVSFSLPCRDHPRTCGEQPGKTSLKSSQTGSPPHMRGTAIQGKRTTRHDRITPAHAGNRRWRK